MESRHGMRGGGRYLAQRAVPRAAAGEAALL